MTESPFWSTLGRYTAYVMHRLWNGLRAENLENLPPDGPYLMVSNHLSFLDPTAIGSASKRTLGYVARDSLFRIALFGGLLRRLGAIPIDRDGADRASIRRILDRLANGRPVLLFAEGTRGDGRDVMPFKRGFLVIVKLAGVPVVPVAVVGSDRALPRGTVLPRPARITVRFGRPIPSADVLALGAEGVRQEVRRLWLKGGQK